MTFFEPKKARSRRNEIRGEVRRDRPGPVKKLVDQAGSVRGERGMLTLTVAITFAVIASSILMLRPRVVDYRPGQVTTEPVFARVEFDVLDEQRLGQARQRAADAKPRVYRPADDDPFAKLEDDLLASPSRSTGLMQDQLAGDATQKVGLVTVFDANDGAALARLQGFTGERAGQWQRSVRLYVDALRDLGLILLPADAAAEDGRQPIQLESGQIVLAGQRLALPADEATRQEIERRVNGAAFEAFGELLYPKIVAFTSQTLQPTVVPDLAATARVRGEASARVPESAGELVYREGQRLLPRGHRLDESDWQLLRAENDSYRASLGNRVWFERTGLAGLAILLTVAMSAYVLHYRPKIAANPSRAAGLATLLLGCLLIAQLAALGTGSLVLLALGPIFLAGITLSVAYDGRFALGIGGLLALLVTLALGQGVGFFLVACAGLLPACLMPGEVRTRSRLIEVGGTVGIIAGAAALVAGLARMEPLSYLLASSAWAALAGFGAGGLVLCVLPFIERAFRITTGLTLLEYLDHPLLRRLAMEAPGTYNHSLQVATISEEAAKAINADGLLCRVACYYHDVGKLRKPEYFIENQRANEAAG
ncbi:MAG: HDIG domain-containing metalloprotein, partial [Planctomycetota bacterium]